MTREWKPGDVVWIPGVGRAIATGDGDRFLVGRREDQKRHIDNFLQVRPLVVLDPEDGDALFPILRQVRDTAFKAGDTYPGMTAFTEAFQAALRSLVAPPKPDEPKGLGAVVEDADGRRWVRTDGDRYLWRGRMDDTQVARRWSAINAVRVLDEGVA